MDGTGFAGFEPREHGVTGDLGTGASTNVTRTSKAHHTFTMRHWMRVDWEIHKACNEHTAEFRIVRFLF